MFVLNLLTPDAKIVLDQELESLVVPTVGGELQVLVGHSPLFTLIQPGILKFQLKGQSPKVLSVQSGYCEIFPGGVNVLVEGALTAEQVQLANAEKGLQENLQRLAKETLSDSEFEEAQSEVLRYRSEISLKQKVH